MAQANDSRNTRQRVVFSWVVRAFGWRAADSIRERRERFLEEAIELYQACGGDFFRVGDIARHVYAKPIGDIGQEAGGVGVTLLSLCSCVGVSAEYCERSELERVLALPIEHFRARQNFKAAAGIAMRVPE